MERPNRYFFDPITLGIHIPESVIKPKVYSDDLSIIDESIFVHEISHYLQFYSSCFGYVYLFNYHVFIKHSLAILKHLSKNNELVCPVAFNYPVDLEEIFPNSDEAMFVLKNINMERYYTEELYGWTYPLFLIEPVRRSDGELLKTFPLYLYQKDVSPFGVSGESIIENQASWNQMNYLSNGYPERNLDIIKQLINNQDNEIYSKYHGINTWFNNLGIGHLADIMYFIILNQPQWDLLDKRGDYVLVHSLKSILKKAILFKDFTPARNDKETDQLISIICKETNLSNPFANLEQLKQYIVEVSSEKYKSDPDWIIDWNALQIVDWTLKNKTSAISWSNNPMELLKKIPIINLFADTTFNVPLSINIPSNIEESTSKYLGSSMVRYLVYNIMTNKQFECPSWIYVRPSLCKSCKHCDGILPSKHIGIDCPVLKIINKLCISNLKTI
jgi:hypothetical protein